MHNISNEFSSRDDYGNFEANLRFLHKAIKFNKEMKVLEIGSGKGRLLNYFFRNGYDINGIEISEAMINESNRLYGDLPLDKMSCEALLFKDSSFDVVLSFDVFEHIADSDRHLQEVKRVLKSGGYYLLQTPNKWTNAIFETIRWRSVIKWRKDHCSLHSYWQIKRRLEKNGFEVMFYDMSVLNEFFTLKIKTYLGNFGLFMLEVVNLNKLPRPLRTNFYIKARKGLN